MENHERACSWLWGGIFLVQKFFRDDTNTEQKMEFLEKHVRQEFAGNEWVKLFERQLSLVCGSGLDFIAM
jgi:hypothetical protein